MLHRLFISIDPPEEIRDELGSLCAGLEKIRWSPEEQFHLTLRFIGGGDGLLVRNICEALEGLRSEPFDLSIRGTGHFPPRGAPQVLWAGLEPSDRLAGLYRSAENALSRCGLEREGRKFHPHITLGRLKGEPVHEVGRWLSRTALFRAGPFAVETFHLYSSRLTPGGAIHDKLATFRFGDSYLSN